MYDYKTIVETAFNTAKENKISLLKMAKQIRKSNNVWQWIEKNCDTSLSNRHLAKKFYSAAHNSFLFTCPHGFKIDLTERYELKFSKIMKNGCSCYQQYNVSPYIKQKKELSIKRQKETMLKKYGYETNNERPEFKELCKRTNLQKYGYAWSAQNKIIHQKTKNTCKKKYGAEFPLQNKEINTQSKKTSLERYKVLYPMQNSEIWSKAVKTNLKNANGLRNWRHISEESKKILLDKNKFSKELQTSSIKELSKKLKVSPNFILTMHNKYKLNIVKSGISSYENEIKSWLHEDNINFKFKDRQEIKPKELDFYFPEYKFAIEFQGDYWHMNPKFFKEDDVNEKNKLTAKQIWDCDEHKINMCTSKGINLFSIWESDWNLNKEEIKKQLKEKLGVM